MSNWMNTVGRPGNPKIGTHTEAQLIDGDEYGLRNVLRHGAGSDENEFPLERGWHRGAKLVQQEYWPRNKNPFTGSVSVKDTLNSENISER